MAELREGHVKGIDPRVLHEVGDAQRELWRRRE
jgi:hypothetical protein